MVCGCVWVGMRAKDLSFYFVFLLEMTKKNASARCVPVYIIIYLLILEKIKLKKNNKRKVSILMSKVFACGVGDDVWVFIRQETLYDTIPAFCVSCLLWYSQQFKFCSIMIRRKI